MIAFLTNVAPIALGFVAKLFSKIDDTNAKIQQIFNMLNQIRYFLYGGFAYFLASEVGIFNVLRLIA